MNTEEKQKTLKRIFWDYNFTTEELYALMDGKVERLSHLDIYGFYARLLTYTGWYAIIDIIGKERLKEALSETVLKRIFSRDLRKKYAIAKRILYG